MNGFSQPLVNGHDDRPQTPDNDTTTPWLVVKFGGTSIGKDAHLIAENIIPLLRAAKVASNANTRAYEDIVTCIQDDHIASAKINIHSPIILESLFKDIDDEFRNLERNLVAVQTFGRLPGVVDSIISRGETPSSRFMQAVLEDRGVQSVLVDLSEAINSEVSPGLLTDIFYKSLSNDFVTKVKACGHKVPVITGYFGPVPGGLLNEIGRGYTDLCAALVAVGLHAEELQIWKEVDGVYTADPRKVPTATLLPSLSPAEAAELAFYGSEVIHPSMMQQVIDASIPIRIKNVFKTRGEGTLIKPGTVNQSLPGHNPGLFCTRSARFLKDTKPKRPTAVTVKKKITVINVHSNKRTLLHDFYQGIFSILSKWRLSVDLVSTSEVHVSLALHSELDIISGGSNDDSRIVKMELKSAIDELKQYGDVKIIHDMAIVSLVGKQMKHMLGIVGKMFSLLGENNINIEMISQGASEINISCVIEARDSDRALSILHTGLFTFLEGVRGR